MKILYLTTVLPSGKTTGGEIASQTFIDALIELGHDVLVLGYQRIGDRKHPKDNEIIVGDRHIETSTSKYYPILWMGVSFLRHLPYSAAKYYSQKYLQKIHQLTHQQAFDIIIIDHAQLSWVIPHINHQQQIILVAHNIEHEVYQKQLLKSQNILKRFIIERESNLIQKIENKLATIAKKVWTINQHDYDYFQKINSDTQQFHLPLKLISTSDKSTKTNYDIAIIGTWTWQANHLGLEWFFQSVYPLIPEHFTIHVAGKGANWLINKYPNVNYHGFVENSQLFMLQAKVIAIPSVSGTGIQIKTLDAIATAKPIVATSLALRGIVDYPSSVQSVETPEEFAAKLCHLLAYNSDTLDDLFTESHQWVEKRQKSFLGAVQSSVEII
ncbi:glycosyltransferase [Calothrix sp. 336/3]|uniref:glycosyltransferase n=1 Tax=Calothrix sp. 336/3 TaxID=1337936 RepID=UPI00054E123A|nr:glycosyltransferase [Calothrix sp. 336/3]AKG23525.1 hypothetical protein IJ00_21575 [Calothrix sp. 336/3]